MGKSENDDEKKPKSKGCGIPICQPGYPKHVFFIIGNEFCERFCYYGMRAILQSYLMLKLGQDPDTAGAMYHAFAIVSYFMPLPGAIVADSCLGKYWTIFSLSIVYVVGNIIMSLTTLGPGYLAGALVGMFSIAVGTGGIKPCVSSFGAEQFSAEQTEWQKAFFSLFYISINAGALLAQIITPFLKSTSCFGEENCWVLAFGLPAALMLVALVFFVIGTPFYTRVPVKENVIVKMTLAVGKAIGRSCGKNKREVDHWLDRAVPDYSQQFVDDCKAVFRVLVLFLPLPFWWALFDQSGSRWTLMAQKMNTYIDVFDFHLEPEQIQIANGVLIIVLVIVFDNIVYPLCAKCNMFVRPLQRLVGGCCFAVLAFVIIGIIQIDVQTQNDVISHEDISTFRFRVFNLDDKCDIKLRRQGEEIVDAHLFRYETHLYVGFNGTVLEFEGCFTPTPTLRLMVDTSKPLASVFYKNGFVTTVYGNNSFPENDNGEFQAEWLFQSLATAFTPDDNIREVKIVGKGTSGGNYYPSPSGFPDSLQYTDFKSPSYYYQVEYTDSEGEKHRVDKDLSILQGGGYTAFLYNNGTSGEMSVDILSDKGNNKVSAYMQFIAYFVLTCGEILFSITGLSFAFSQAPASMKSILTAAWLMTVSFGNVIDMIIISVSIPDKAVEFFIFAGLMAVVTVIFAIMTCFYTYVEDIERTEEELAKEDPDHHHPQHMHHATPYKTLPSQPYMITESVLETSDEEKTELKESMNSSVPYKSVGNQEYLNAVMTAQSDPDFTEAAF